MLEIPMFWLGPLGRMVPLACPQVGLSNSLKMQSASNSTVNARNVIDLQGFRRTWTMTEAWLDANEVSLFEAMFNGTMMPPHRIIDPLRKNRLRPSVAAPRKTSLWWGGTDAWYLPAGQGVVNSIDLIGLQDIQYVTEGDQREVSWHPDNCIIWDATANGNQLLPNGSLKPDGDAYKSRVDPILPGEELTFSFYARKTGTPNFTAHLATVTSSMDLGTPTSTVSITNAGWQRYSITYTAPTNGSIAGVFPVFTALGDSVVELANMQLEVGDVASQWETGYGAPEVAITQFDSVSPRYPMVTASLVIQEL